MWTFIAPRACKRKGANQCFLRRLYTRWGSGKTEFLRDDFQGLAVLGILRDLRVRAGLFAGGRVDGYDPWTMNWKRFVLVAFLNAAVWAQAPASKEVEAVYPEAKA